MPFTPQKMPRRIVVYAKDVENITGKRERAARILLQKIRTKFDIPKDGFVTVRAFSIYTCIDEDLVRAYLMD